MDKLLNGVMRAFKARIKQQELRSKRNKPEGLRIVLMLIGVAGRLLPHVPNVTPIGGLGIWSGMRLEGQARYAIPLSAMLISDLFLGFHHTMPYVYGAIIVNIWLASQIKKPSIWSVSGITFANALLFFVVTNFGVWYTSRFYTVPLYPLSWQGLIASYIAALPFLRFSLVGDFVYVGAFFSLERVVLALAQKKVTAKQSSV
jgi:hypothetical protein